jgi:hypothetical protein
MSCRCKVTPDLPKDRRKSVQSPLNGPPGGPRSLHWSRGKHTQTDPGGGGGHLGFHPVSVQVRPNWSSVALLNFRRIPLKRRRIDPGSPPGPRYTHVPHIPGPGYTQPRVNPGRRCTRDLGIYTRVLRVQKNAFRGHADREEARDPWRRPSKGDKSIWPFRQQRRHNLRPLRDNVL